MNDIMVQSCPFACLWAVHSYKLIQTYTIWTSWLTWCSYHLLHTCERNKYHICMATITNNSMNVMVECVALHPQNFLYQSTHQLIKPGIWAVTPFSLVEMYQRSEGKCCFHLQCINFQRKYRRRLPLKHCCPFTNLQGVTSQMPYSWSTANRT